ncbi:bifunctional diaminohydroxyphosphoribosylaminopyrimidine deaminase/5-amino-6-(5-phosphoribosylamino)uracil reductase RibD [Pseudocnuella soli]|uniref:bifunctional diaminohydroxyphosphoribosylaminopyrimidine deaminase/5-amino-6-(5-phosphoribosylamino)uracil reductase RibD n=1 Tax=Pseudocnuella soli TaxID=2502779 RepID=UPI001F02727E|nr:bifunctional diaminohydroxyphosphoribosylaminopyrimidine deaminase/5-amino-6-(5-phosphoribosylamino)uracil reductase RibD [Pseudocnuella soli]
METVHHQYMYRCLQLAALGRGNVAPNPMVGAVLVHRGRIIGEGWHQQSGGPHAEVACVASVAVADRHLVKDATMYVSLEPCAHWGKTPPCADLIVREQIKTVVVGCRDPFPLVAGKGIEKLRAAGVEVITGVLEQECIALNVRFFLFHTQRRPYIVLKWAQTGDGNISAGEGRRLKISNAFSDRLVHKWRSEEAAILVGTNTARTDNPELTTRLWPGHNPLRLVVDLDGKLPESLKLFDRTVSTIVFNRLQHTIQSPDVWRKTAGVYYFKIEDGGPLVQQMGDALYQLGVQSVLVEGGAQMLQSFIDAGLWDEARIITNEALMAAGGVAAPVLKNHQFTTMEQLDGDTIRYYTHQQPQQT